MSRRISTATEAAFLIFAVSAATGFLLLGAFDRFRPAGVILSGAGQSITLRNAVILSVSFPAFASILLVLLAWAIKPLIPGTRIAFPMNLTFPIIHAFILIALVRLALVPPNALEPPPSQLVVATFWLKWIPITVSVSLQILILSLFAWMGPRQQAGVQ